MIDAVLVIVTIVSLVFAAVMGMISWRVLYQERRRSEVRVAALSDAVDKLDAEAPEAAVASWPPVRPAVAVRQASAARSHAQSPDLFSHPEPAVTNGRRFAMAAGLGATVVAIALGAVLALNEQPVSTTPVSPAAAQVRPPLELVSLDHARDGGQLAIRGLVRNPTSGDTVKDLVAVVFLFDRQGGYLGTSHAPVIESVLAPGAESPFEVPIAARFQVGRYRLSFRNATAPVPHVDRRAATRPAPAESNRASVERRASVVSVSTPAR